MDYSTLEALLSKQRLSTYLLRSHGDPSKAILLYEKNISIASSLWSPISHVEIAFRNRIQSTLTSEYGEHWYMHADMPKRIVAEIARIHPEIFGTLSEPSNNQRLVNANLSLGFWCKFLDVKFEKEFWVKVLHKAFAPKTDRRALHADMTEIRKVRNRIAHHEHLLDLNTENFLTCLMGVAEQIKPGFSDFVFSTRFKPETSAKPKQLRHRPTPTE